MFIYKTIVRSSLLPDDKLNELGSDGWDLIQVHFPDHPEDNYVYFLKQWEENE